jgi:hypothetical protein
VVRPEIVLDQGVGYWAHRTTGLWPLLLLGHRHERFGGKCGRAVPKERAP